MPSSFSSKPGYYDDADPSTADSANASKANAQGSILDNKKRPTPNDANKGFVLTKCWNLPDFPAHNSFTQSIQLICIRRSWIGGIFNKLSLKPKNQMILPDDKDPTVSTHSALFCYLWPSWWTFAIIAGACFIRAQIVWDPEKKKWMNKDHEESEAEAFKPPPKMSDLMGPAAAVAPINSMPNIPAMQSPVTPIEHRNEPNFGAYPTSPNLAPTPAPAPNLNSPPMPAGNSGSGADAIAATNKIPSLQSNMFKMQRNKSE